MFCSIHDFTSKTLQRPIQRGFATGQPVWELKFLPQIDKKTKTLKVILNELSPNTISNTIDKGTIVTFSIVNNPCPCHSYMFTTEKCSSKFMIMSFWAPPLNSPAENGIPKKYLDKSLLYSLLALH